MKPYKSILFIFLVMLIWSDTDAQTSSPKQSTNASDRPNIVFMMSDDHAYQAISAYGSNLIETPNIDRIAKEGMLFTNATVTNSICAPSRATILTGMHCHKHGKVDNILPFDTSNITFPQLFQDAGYETAMFGKLHFGNNPKGVDKFMILPGQGQYVNPRFITDKGDTTINGYVTDIITDLTLDWMDKERDTSKPFLLMYFHKAPHRNWVPAQRHYETFTKRTFPMPESLFDDYVRARDADGNAVISKPAQSAEMSILKDMTLGFDLKVNLETLTRLGISEKHLNSQATLRMNDEQKEAWFNIYDDISEDFAHKFATMDSTALLRWKYQRYMQDYLATIAAVDENVGRMLDYLEENGLAENTIIVYTSDQGFYLGEHGWFDKRFMYKESFRTPLMIKWPGTTAPGSSSDKMVQNLDYAQTLMEIGGIPAHPQMQGLSLVPLLKGNEDDWQREAAYYHYYEYPGEHTVKRHYGIATDRYKLIHFYHDIDVWELYDTKADPNEMRNVYNDPAYLSIKNELTAKLTELRAIYGDSEMLDRLYLRRSNASKP